MHTSFLGLLLSQTVQVAILALIVWLLVRTVAKNRSHLAHALWALVLIKCVTPPLWSSPAGVFSLVLQPIVSVAARMLSRESEQSCDEETIAGLRCDPSTYARCLLGVLEQKSQLRVAPALPGVRPVDVTAKRLERIMRLRHGSCCRAPRWVWPIMFLAAFAILPGATKVRGQNQELPNRTISAAPEALPHPPLPSIKGGAGWGVAQFNVKELLESLAESGLSQAEAKTKLLQTIPPLPEDRLDRDAKLFLKGRVIELGGNNPRVRIVDSTLYVLATAKDREEISQHVEHHRQFGFRILRITATLAQIPSKQWDEMDVRWNAASHSDPPKRLLTPEGIPQASQTVRQTSATTEIKNGAALKTATFDAESADDFVRSIEGATILSRPQIVTHNGRAASIEIGQSKTFVVGFQSSSVDGRAKFEPVNLDVHSGTRLRMKPILGDDHQVRLEFGLEISRLRKVETIKLPLKQDGKVLQVQVPETVSINVESAADVPLGKVFAFAGPEVQEGDEPYQLLCLLRCDAVELPDSSQSRR